MKSSTYPQAFDGREMPERGDLWENSDGHVYRILYRACRAPSTLVEPCVVLQSTGFRGGDNVEVIDLSIFMSFDWDKTKPGFYVPLFTRVECDR